MRRPLLVALALTLTACGLGPKTMNERVDVRSPTVLAAVGIPADVHVNIDSAVAYLRQRRLWNETVWWDTVANAPAAGLVSTHISSPNRTAVGADTIGDVPCGGDLPPCSRVQIESGGTWDAFNDGGCGGNNCYGPYQFSGAWAGKLGLPLDLTQTTHEQWVAAARELWDNGAGCSNWSC